MSTQRALVCGASQGIGLAVAKRLAADGLAVTLYARRKEQLEKNLQELPGSGHDFLAADVAKPESWKEELLRRHQEQAYSVLICNSGGPPAGPISQASPQDFLQAMTNHLATNALMTQIFLDHMKESQFGRIITITSTSVKVPIPHLGVSNTARAAVASWGKTLSLELAPFGITVNNVMPGFTKTPRLVNLIKSSAEKQGKSYQDVEQEWKNKVPMKRFADPDETADLIGFLVSQKASYITGQNIAVDGGRTGCL